MEDGTAKTAEPPLVSHEQIKKAIEALLVYIKKKKNANALLLNENENVFLIVTLWKIPPNGKEIKIPLPHGIRPHTKEVCLFTKDESNLTSEQTENFYKKLLKKKGVTSITQIIPYKKLKHEYKPFEAKQRLLSSFDLFLADQRIRRLLPSHIGKHFYRRKKVPLSVDLTTQNLAEKINRIIQGTTLTVSNQGCCNTARVGHTGMPIDHLVENIVAAVGVLSEKLPEKWESVKILHLKTEKSLSLPVFSSFVSHVGSHQKKKKQKQGKKVSTDPAQPAVKPESEAASEPKAQKESRAEADSEDEIPQLVPIQEESQKSPQVQKVALRKESTGESLSPETPQVKTPSKKRKASTTLETPKQINQGSTELKTPPTGKRKKPAIAKKAEKESNSSLEVKEVKALEKTPKKPRAKSFTAHNKVGKIIKSAQKAPKTPRQKKKAQVVPGSV